MPRTATTFDFIDISGQTFGRYAVVRRAENDADGNARWHCRCECGAERVVPASNLRNGHSRGCRTCSSRDKPRDTPATLKHFRSLTQPQWERVCAVCGRKFRGTAKQKYCSDDCRPAGSRKRGRAETAE